MLETAYAMAEPEAALAWLNSCAKLLSLAYDEDFTVHKHTAITTAESIAATNIETYGPTTGTGMVQRHAYQELNVSGSYLYSWLEQA